MRAYYLKVPVFKTARYKYYVDTDRVMKKGAGPEIMPPTIRITAKGENGLMAHLEIVGENVDPKLVKSAHNWIRENFDGDVVSITNNKVKSLPNGYRLVSPMSKNWEESWNEVIQEEKL